MKIEENKTDVGYEIKIAGTFFQVKEVCNWLEENCLYLRGVEWGTIHSKQKDSMWIEFNTKEHSIKSEYMGFKLKWM